MAISIMVHLRKVCATSEPPISRRAVFATATPAGRVGAQHMKRHSHAQSGLAISDGQWVIDISYNIGLDPCSRKSPSPCSIHTLLLQGFKLSPPSSFVRHHHHHHHHHRRHHRNHGDAYT